MEEYTRKGGNFLCEDHSSLSAPIEHHEDTSKLSNMMMSRGQYSNSSCSLRLDEKTVNSEGSGRSLALTFLVGILGVLSATMFVCFGVTAEAIKQDQAFHHVAEEFALQVEAALVDYETASRWLHQACAFQNITRSEFHDLYEYMTLSLEVQVGCWRGKYRCLFG